MRSRSALRATAPRSARAARAARVVRPVLLAAFVAACTGGATQSPSSAASMPPSSAPSAVPSAEAVRVEVRLTDEFRIEPDPMTIPVGVPVTFVVTNAGALDHEFFVGDAAAQDEHEQEMVANGGMMHDHSNAIGVKPGATKELTMTFEAATSLLAGCHIAGHYAAGMKATIEVAP